MDELKNIFIEEATDINDRIRDLFDGFVAASDKEERLIAVLRGIHTIKGGAATCEMAELKQRSHKLESGLLKYKGRADELTQKQVNRVLGIIDRFQELLGDSSQHGQESKEQESPSDTLFGEQGSPPPTSPAHTSRAKDAVSMPAPVGTSTANETIRVPIERIQRNFDVISEIFLTRNQLKYLIEKRISGGISDSEFFQGWEVLDNTLRKSIGELEHIAMSMRMMPIKSLLRRMESAVRSYTADRRKDIQVRVKGEDTELDKKVLDSLAEPLIHLTRNAMDHGIETPEERRRAGKPESASISFEAVLSGNEVVLSISDDGRGIDHRQVLESARRKGLDVSGIQTRDEALQLIFRPGFSTREEVTDVSGRGIGMDAVRSYVEGIGGSIEIETEVGKGTTFVLRLPIGMSVVPAITARCNGQIFAITSSDVMEIRNVPRDDISFNGSDAFYNRSGTFIPCFDVGSHLYNSIGDNKNVRSDRVALCFVETDDGLVALRVDELLSNVEIVTQSIPSMACPLPYVTGVSIMATGEPTFVVSLKLLYRKVIKPATERENHREAA